MIDLKYVYDKIKKCNIDIYPFGINGIKAVTIETDNKYGIFLNQKEIKNSNEEFCVLTHEYGHCMSGATHILYSPLDLISRHEYRADRKAILDFLPVDNIKNAIKNGYETIYEISEYLNMPEEFILKAIKHYTYMGLI